MNETTSRTLARNGTMKNLVKRIATETADTLYERLNFEWGKRLTREVPQEEIDHLISSLDKLDVLRLSVEACIGVSKRRICRARPLLRHIDNLAEYHRHRLERCGVVAICTDGTVDLSMHEIRETKFTTDPGQHRMICDVWRTGFADNKGSVIRPAIVVARRFDNSPNKNNEKRRCSNDNENKEKARSSSKENF